MTKINKLQFSFVAGLISPRVYGRVDLPQYMTSLQTCTNFFISPFGTAVRRSGTHYITSLVDQTKQSRLVPFVYSDTQAYMLEFSNGLIRFYKDQGIILQSRGITNGTFDSGITGWTDASTAGGGSANITYDGTNHRMNLNATGGGTAIAEATMLPNMGINTYTVTVDVITNSIAYKVGTTANASDIATGTLTTGTGKTFTFTPTVNGNVYITFTSTSNAAIDNVVLSMPIYEIDSPYSDSDVQVIGYTQSFDTLYIAHPNYAPMKLTRTGHDNWTLASVSFSEPAWADLNLSAVTMTPSAATGSITVTCSSPVFASTDVGRSIRMKNTVTTAENIYYPGTGAQTFFTIPFFPNDNTNVNAYIENTDGSQTQLTYVASGPSSGQFTITSGQVVTGDTITTSQKLLLTPFYVGSAQWGYCLITGFTNATTVTATVTIPLSGANPTTNWRISAWGVTTGYPSYCAIYNQRLWFANSSAFPSTIWASVAGDLENYRPDDISLLGIVTDASAIVLQIDTPAIKWLRGLKVMVIGCSDGVLEITSASGGVSPLTVFVQKDMNTNCSSIIPTQTSDQIIFVENLEKKIYATKYYFQYAGFYPNELTKYYDNVPGTSTVSEIVYTESPSRLVWVRRADGGLWSCAYLFEDQTTGWSNHTLGGNTPIVESIATIPGTSYSELWMIVNRQVNGVTARFVEVLQPEYNSSGQNNAFFVDAGATYSGVSTSTITGLDYLDGETVSVLGNGAAQNNKVVSGGSITLDVPVTIAQVGLPYTSTLQTPLIEGGCTIGTSQTAIARIHHLGIRFHETLGGSFGEDLNNMDTIIFNSTSDVMDSAPPIQSGDQILEFSGNNGLNYQAFIQQTQPYPMTVLCLIYKAIVADV